MALLEPATFDALRHLSVFAATFTPDDAERVLGCDVRDHLIVLREQNLVATTADGRLRLLEPVRQYARAHLTTYDTDVFEQHLDWVRQ